VIALLREISRVCAEQQLKAPIYRTVRRRLSALDLEAVTRSRLGAKTARKLYQPVQRSPFDDLLPLELVQIYHTQLDVIVVDESERRPIGRPWMTLAIDVASRVVSGFYVSVDPPASISVAMALTQSVLRKISGSPIVGWS
jgi:putative transposase